MINRVTINMHQALFHERKIIAFIKRGNSIGMKNERLLYQNVAVYQKQD